MERYDIAIIGAGIAGLSLAHAIGHHATVAVIEQEAGAGAHATARSTATFVESYGSPIVRALTTASRGFFIAPPAGFPSVSRPRGNLRVGRAGEQHLLEAEYHACRILVPALRRLNQAETLALCPALRPERIAGGLYEPGALDLDVAGLRDGYLAAAHRAGVRFRFSAAVRAVARSGGGWHLSLAGSGTLSAAIVVNAAGAWADRVAGICGLPPLGIMPLRRTVIVIPFPEQWEATLWPLVRDAYETVYFKPGEDGLMVTPCDEASATPGSLKPQPGNITDAVRRLETATRLRASPILRAWAGLRSFLPDRLPAVGFDPLEPSFFWLTGQGGYGLQTAPAISRLAAGLLLGRASSAPAEDILIESAALTPARLRC